jgi:hypothetical protein
MKQAFLQILLLMALSSIFSCKEEKSIPKVDHINVNMEVVRFDQLLFGIDTNNLETNLKNFAKNYPSFYPLYFKNVLPLTDDSTKLGVAVKAFINDKQIRNLYDTTQIALKDWSKVEADMKRAFQYIKFHIPTFEAPRIYTFISEFGMQRFLFSDRNKDGLGIGLDMFLGNQFPYKNIDPTNPNFSGYLTRTFNKDHIVPKSMDLLIDNMVESPTSAKLLDIMIHNGKKLYLKQLFLPATADTLIYEYTPAQMEWVKNNELEIWSFFADQNLVYESVPNKIAKYLNPSPSAPGMPSEAPGSTANYIGLKIIEAYLQKFPNTTIEQLINLKDAQKILELSKYKPKRK